MQHQSSHPKFGSGLAKTILSEKKILEANKIEAINNQKSECQNVLKRNSKIRLHNKHKKALRNNFKTS